MLAHGQQSSGSELGGPQWSLAVWTPEGLYLPGVVPGAAVRTYRVNKVGRTDNSEKMDLKKHKSYTGKETVCKFVMTKIRI